MAPSAGAVLLYSFYRNDRNLTYVAIGLAAATMLVIVVQWVVASRTRCPLCLTPVLANKQCSKHRNARKLLGSHRLRVAMAILFRGSFMCPFCHEPSVLEVRGNRSEYRVRRY